MNPEKKIKFFLLNVRGIVSELNLQEFQKKSKPDVIGLTETITNSIDSNELEEHEVFP